MEIYHWTLNRPELKAKGFVSHQDRHSEGELCIWFTDRLMGEPESIKPEIKMVTMEVPEDDIVQYEETNSSAGYRTFRIPANVANKYELKFPTLYVDRGIFKLIPF